MSNITQGENVNERRRWPGHRWIPNGGLNFRQHYKATVIKTAWYWNRLENPERNPHKYGQLLFDKGAKNIQG